MGIYTQGSSVYRRAIDEEHTLVIRSRDLIEIGSRREQGWAAPMPDCGFVATIIDTDTKKVVTFGYGRNMVEAEQRARSNLARRQT